MNEHNNQSKAAIDLAVLIVSFFSASLVSDLLKSIRDVGGPIRVGVVITDNSCDDSEWEKLNIAASSYALDFAHFELVRAQKNRGFGAGNWESWLAIQGMDPTAVLLMNPDVFLVRGSLYEVYSQICASPRMIYGARTDQNGEVSSGLSRMSLITGRSTRIKATSSRSLVVYPDGHFMAMSAEIWRLLGGFDQDYFLYCEEVDFCMRARSEGNIHSVQTLCGIEIKHEGGATTSSRRNAKSALTSYHSTRSRMLLLKKHRKISAYATPLLLTRLAQAAILRVRGQAEASRAVLAGLRAYWTP